MSDCLKNSNYRTVKNDKPQLDITKEEFARIHEALGKEEFRNLFFEYLQEIQDPENRKRYEDELKEFEKERGVDVVFLHPKPGFVIKTSVNGEVKCFINIACCAEIDEPSTKHAISPDTGEHGLSWALPMAQAPVREDVDAKGKRCKVYDVMYNPRALELAKRRNDLRKYLIDTALDAVEREQNVRLDRANLKFPKLDYKGIAQPVVLRKLMSNATAEQAEPHPLEHIYPPKPTSESSKPKVLPLKTSVPQKPAFCMPKYSIKHSHNVDLSECTDELDAKLNLTVPHALIIEIELPLLTSIENSELDVTDRTLHFSNQQPGAKYALQLNLPYAVDDKAGSAKFDLETRRLTINLPVLRATPQQERTKHNVLLRNDSGVELHCSSDGEDASEHDDKQNAITADIMQVSPTEELTCPFLNEPEKCYKLPEKFNCSLNAEEMVFTIEVRNVQNNTINLIKHSDQVSLRFSTLGGGFYSNDYAFLVKLLPTDAVKYQIVIAEALALDNNLTLNLKLSVAPTSDDINCYLAGFDIQNLKKYRVCKTLVKSIASVDAKESSDESSSVKIKTKPSKKQRKRNKKLRSSSESEFFDIRQEQNESLADLQTNLETVLTRKQRSYSECQDVKLANAAEGIRTQKSILKRVSRYGPLSPLKTKTATATSCCSSFEEQEQELSLSCPINVGGGANHEEQQGSTECCKKSVRFNDHILQQTFRCDSSILGRRKKNQKCRERKMRALQRRLSESDSVDYYEANMKHIEKASLNCKKLVKCEEVEGNCLKSVTAAIESLSLSFDEDCSSSDDFQTPMASEISE